MDFQTRFGKERAPSSRPWLAALAAELTLVHRTAAAGPVCRRPWVSALTAEFTGVGCAAVRAVPSRCPRARIHSGLRRAYRRPCTWIHSSPRRASRRPWAWIHPCLPRPCRHPWAWVHPGLLRPCRRPVPLVLHLLHIRIGGSAHESPSCLHAKAHAHEPCQGTCGIGARVL